VSSPSYRKTVKNESSITITYFVKKVKIRICHVKDAFDSSLTVTNAMSVYTCGLVGESVQATLEKSTG
jgi:hypothetical protein